MHTELVEKYVNLWKSAMSANSAEVDKFDPMITHLTWRGHEMACIRDSEVNEPIYAEEMELEENMDLAIVSLKRCDFAMGNYIAHVGILEAICNTWDEVANGKMDDIVFTVNGVEYGAIQFSHSQITFRTRDNNGGSPVRRGLDAMLQYSTNIVGQLGRIDSSDDIAFVKSLMRL